jgi:hypothetical protein
VANDSPKGQVFSRRVTEWGIVTLVLLVLIVVLWRQALVMQAQTERVAVRATLAAIRAGLVVDQLVRQVRPNVANSAPLGKNPFTLLQAPPPNYAGERTLGNIYSVPPGSWVFDPDCRCVGYRLLYPRWLEPEQEADAIWFRVETTPQDSRLVEQAGYRWFGQKIN